MHSAPPPPLGKALHLPVQTTYPLVGGGSYPFPMHFYRVFEGFLMVVGGFWPLAAASIIKVLGGCCYSPKTKETIFPKVDCFSLNLNA